MRDRDRDRGGSQTEAKEAKKGKMRALKEVGKREAGIRKKRKRKRRMMMKVGRRRRRDNKELL